MYALPRQTVAEAEADAAAALAFGPPHLSFYHLTLEPNTLFHRYPPPLPDDDAAADMRTPSRRASPARATGTTRPPPSPAPGRECRHNLNYWRFGDYLGIGAGAHSKLSLPDRVLRQMRWKQPKQYLDAVVRGAPVQDETTVGRDDLGFEFMLNALRLSDGVPAASFAERTGFALSIVERELEVAVQRGLLDPDPATLRPTPLGRRFLNDLQALFLKDGRRAARVAR